MAFSFSLLKTPQLKFSSYIECSVGTKSTTNLSNARDWVLPGLDNPLVFIRERVKELALRQEAMQIDQGLHGRPKLDLRNTIFEGAMGPNLLNVAYNRCRELFLVKNDPFNFASILLSNPEKEKAIWALWAWGRRTDEMVDGINGSFATHEILDRMEERVVEIYQGRPRDIYDVALVDTISKYPVDIQLLKNVIDGTRVDLANKRFENFKEHYLYRYYVSASFFLQMVQVIGIAPESTAKLERVYNAMVTLAMGLTFTDMIRDIGEDAKEGRIYFSKDELKLAGVSEDDIFKARVTDNWKNLMREQTKRARMMLDEGAKDINELSPDFRWALWTNIVIYRQDLEVIKANNYDCFSKKTMAGKARRIVSLPQAYAKSIGF